MHERIELVLMSLPVEIAARLEYLPPTSVGRMRIAETVDEALEWIEETILFSHTRAGTISVEELLRAEFGDPDAASLLFGVLQAEVVAAGSGAAASGRVVR